MKPNREISEPFCKRQVLSLVLLAIALLANHSVVLADPIKVDMIVEGDYVLAMDGTKVIKKGAVAIDKGIIVALDLQAVLKKQYSAAQTIPGDGRILLPGLINGHTHSAMALFRGLADDLELMLWLTKYIFPMEAKFVDEEFVRVGMQLACWEMIRGGTTTFVDMYFYQDVAAAVVESCGMRAVLGSPSIDYPSPGFKGWDDSFAAAKKFVERWQGKSARITPAFAPHAPYTVSAEHLAQVAEAARSLGAPVLIHVSESPSERAEMLKKYGRTSVDFLQTTGLLETRIVAAHMVVPTPEEILLLARNNVGVVHNPTSNLKTGAGIAPIPQLLSAGVHVGLGTDGAASNNDLNMWDEIRLAALLHKGVNNDARAVPAEQALRMATIDGAMAVGLGAITGSLEKGKRADLIQVSILRPGLSPVYNVSSLLVYAVQASDVVTSMVDGRLLMHNGQVLSIDRSALDKQVELIAARIQAAL